MAQFDNLPKTIYNNLDGSDKTTQTLPTKVGAWDMEQLVTKINELTTFIRDMASSNDTGIVSFDNIYGTWVNSPSAPVTTAIQYTLADAKNGAVAGVYYQATDLVITDPDSRIVMLTTDAFESDVLCIVWFAFDEGTGGINVNVQTGDTGNRPLPVGNIRPIITLLGQALAQVTVGTSYTDAGATASDSEDGDITSDIVTVNPVDPNVKGNYVVTYNVVDSEALAAIEVIRNVSVVDNQIPVITVLGFDPVDVLINAVYTDAGATAWDFEDGDITANIITVNPVDSSIVGTYTVTYNVTDGNGNDAMEEIRVVHVVLGTPDPITSLELVVSTWDDGSGANEKPVITRLGTSPMSVMNGDSYTDAGATAADTEDGDITGDIVTVNNVDTNTNGTYTITYNVTDSGGLAATEVTRTVTVVADQVPVITMLGSSPISIVLNDSYTDAGATATDVEDGDLTASIITTSNVNTSVLGTYTVEYNVADSYGNDAIEVVRTVNVQEAVPDPVTNLTLSVMKFGEDTTPYPVTSLNLTITKFT